VPEPHELSVEQAGALLRGGGLSSLELTRHALARIDELDPLVRAFVLVTRERALTDAARADRELAAGLDRGPMHGIPYALKDIFDTRGIRTTCHSHLRTDHVPTQDAEVERRLRDGGGVLLGKLATHEFALGGPSPELPFPPARNPWNPAHFTGASSTGAGAAVAAGFVRVAIGSDTSGSIRGPACHCGVVGLKPTYGLVSRRGAFPLSYSLDHVGPVARTVMDAALALKVVAGHDPADPASIPDIPAEPSDGLRNGVSGLRIAHVPSLYAGDPVTSPEVIRGIEDALALLRGMGASVTDVEFPDFALFNACGRVLMTAEAFAIHEEDLRSRPHLYGRYTYQRIAPGAGITAADLVQAQRTRRELADQVQLVFDEFDVLVTACALTPAPPFDVFGVDWPPPREATAMQTIPFNVTGHPALALPFGLSSDGLPLGLQIVGGSLREGMVLRVAHAMESALGHSHHSPRGFGPRTEPVR
jgi:aspartyl-tRNA(Asn)/glutamyl-tRNA(Gln) amidotransferase subunit A